MNAAAERLDFERAAALRDQLKAIEYITREHKAVSPGLADQDVIALARDEGDAVVQILFIRNGKLIGSDSRTLDGTEDENDEEVIGAFLKRFYGESAEVPPEIVLPQNIEEARIIERWLKDRAQRQACDDHRAAARRQAPSDRHGERERRRNAAHAARPVGSRYAQAGDGTRRTESRAQSADASPTGSSATTSARRRARRLSPAGLCS